MTTAPACLEARLREINLLARQLTLNDIPAFYHDVATSLGTAEGFGHIVCDTPPRISNYKAFTVNGFEIHCVSETDMANSLQLTITAKVSVVLC